MLAFHGCQDRGSRGVKAVPPQINGSGEVARKAGKSPDKLLE